MATCNSKYARTAEKGTNDFQDDWEDSWEVERFYLHGTIMSGEETNEYNVIAGDFWSI